MKKMNWILAALALTFVSLASAKEPQRKIASTACDYGNVQEEIYVVFHDANPHVLHISLTPEDTVTFGDLGVDDVLAGKLVKRINMICGNPRVTASDFASEKTLVTVYKKLNVYNP